MWDQLWLAIGTAIVMIALGLLYILIGVLYSRKTGNGVSDPYVDSHDSWEANYSERSKDRSKAKEQGKK